MIVERYTAFRHGQERPRKMDTIYILTGLCTIAAAIAGLVLTCYLERRSFAARRSHARKQPAPHSSEGSPAAT